MNIHPIPDFRKETGEREQELKWYRWDHESSIQFRHNSNIAGEYLSIETFPFCHLCTRLSKCGGVSATNGLTGKTFTSPSDGLFQYGLESASSLGLGMHFVLPGGEQILMDAGRITIDYDTGERIFEAGIHDYQDGNWQELCIALAGP